MKTYTIKESVEKILKEDEKFIANLLCYNGTELMKKDRVAADKVFNRGDLGGMKEFLSETMQQFYRDHFLTLTRPEFLKIYSDLRWAKVIYTEIPNISDGKLYSIQDTHVGTEIMDRIEKEIYGSIIKSSTVKVGRQIFN